MTWSRDANKAAPLSNNFTCPKKWTFLSDILKQGLQLFLFASVCNCMKLPTFYSVELLLLFIHYVHSGVIRRNIFFWWVPLGTLMSEKLIFFSRQNFKWKKTWAWKGASGMLDNTWLPCFGAYAVCIILSMLAPKTRSKSWQQSCLMPQKLTFWGDFVTKWMHVVLV